MAFAVIRGEIRKNEVKFTYLFYIAHDIFIVSESQVTYIHSFGKKYIGVVSKNVRIVVE